LRGAVKGEKPLELEEESASSYLTDMEPIGPYRANVGDRLSQIFQQQAADQHRVRVQYPINWTA
jgi:hypothetical protein